MFMYQKKMPRLMKEKSVTSMRLPNDGDFQMLKGKIGSLATFSSQYEKPAKWRMETIRRTIS